MNTNTIIAEDLADIEQMRIAIAVEVARSTHDKAVQAGVEAYAKARIEDLRGLLAVYVERQAYQPIQDMLAARINAIAKAYGLSPAA